MMSLIGNPIHQTVVDLAYFPWEQHFKGNNTYLVFKRSGSEDTSILKFKNQNELYISNRQTS